MADIAAPPTPTDVAGDYGAQAQKIVSAESEAQAGIQQRWDAERAPAAAEAATASDDLARAAARQPQTLPLPENTAKHLDPKELNSAASAFMTLGALAGLLSRQSMTAALNNMTAAMKGVQEGDAERYDREYKEFQSNFDKAMKANKAMLDEKDKALKDTSMTLTARMNQLRLIDTKYGNEVGRNTKTFDQQMKLLDAQMKAAQHASDQRMRLDMFNESLAARREAHADNMALQRERLAGAAGSAGGASGSPSGLSKEAIDFYSQQALMGDQSWRTGLSRTKQGTALILAVDNRVPEMAAEMGLSPQDIGTNKATYAALTKTLADRQKYTTSVEQLAGNMTKQADLVLSLLDKGAAGGGSPVLNKWIQAGRQATGDPDVDALNTAITGLAREHQRVLTSPLSNAQLSVAAQHTGDSLISIAKTPDQIKSVIGVMRQEVANARKQAEETLTETKNKMRAINKPADEKPKPTDADREWAKHSPANRASYVKHFGQEP